MTEFTKAQASLSYDLTVLPKDDIVLSKYALAQPRRGKIKGRSLQVVKTAKEHWCWVTKKGIPSGTFTIIQHDGSRLVECYFYETGVVSPDGTKEIGLDAKVER